LGFSEFSEKFLGGFEDLEKKSGSGEEVQVQGEARVLGLSGKCFWGGGFLFFVLFLFELFLEILGIWRFLGGLLGFWRRPGGTPGDSGSILQGRRLLLPGVPTKRTNNNPNDCVFCILE